MASYLITFVDTEGNGITGLEQSGEIPYNTSKLVFYNTSVEFRDNWNLLDSVTWNDVYQGKAVESVVYNGSEVSDGEEVDYSGGDIEIVVGYEYTPPGTVDPGGSGGGPGGEDSDTPSTETPDVAPIQFSFTVKFYKAGTTTEVRPAETKTCYYVTREDEGIIGNYGTVFLTYYTGYENTGNGYSYINPQTIEIDSTITGYKLSGFHGIENGGSITGSKDGQNEYPFEAYYIDNDFTVTIDAKGIDRSQVIVQNPNTTSIKYNLPYVGNFPNQALLLEAITNNEEYEFDYWEVNGEKIYDGGNVLSYEIESDLEVYCCFKEKITSDDIEDDRIATNDYINSLFNDKNLYTINGDESSPYYELRCPTFLYIKNKGIDNSRPADIIQISNSYESDQCVKEEDISILDKEIKLEFENNNVYNLALSVISIYAAGDDPTKNNSIYEGDIPLIQGWRIEKGSDGGFKDSTKFKIPKNLTEVYNKKLKLKIIGYYGKPRGLKLFTKTSVSEVDRNSSGAVAISGSASGTSNVIPYNFKFNTFLNSSINPPIIRIEIYANA